MPSMFLSQPEVTVPGGYAPAHETLASALASVTADQRGGFEGIASKFGSIAYGERGPTLFAESAFDQTVREKPKVSLYWMHHTEAEKPIGVAWLRVERGVGLFAKGSLAVEQQQAREVAELLRMGSLNSLSIGFSPNPESISWIKVGGQDVRLIGEAKVDEVSVVDFPADPAARMIEVHALSFPAAETFDLAMDVCRERGGGDYEMWQEIQRLTSARREAQMTHPVHPLARLGSCGVVP